MQGKIQLAAPDDARFRKKRPQVLHCIQPVHARKGDHGVGRYIYARCFKEYLLPAVAVYSGKHPALGAEPRKLLCVKNLLCFALCQHGNVVHSVLPSSLFPAVVDCFCFQYTERFMFFKAFGTKAPIPARNRVFPPCRSRKVVL